LIVAIKLVPARDRAGIVLLAPIRASAPILRQLAERCHPTNRCLHWSDSQRRKARRFARRPTDKVRTSHQSQDRQGARPHRAALTARPRRRGDRIRMFCWSARVRFWHNSDLPQCPLSCRYRGHSGHQRRPIRASRFMNMKPKWPCMAPGRADSNRGAVLDRCGWLRKYL
jgi:hypothetical protein